MSHAPKAERPAAEAAQRQPVAGEVCVPAVLSVGAGEGQKGVAQREQVQAIMQSPRVTVQRALLERLPHSPRMLAQRRLRGAVELALALPATAQRLRRAAARLTTPIERTTP